MKFKLSLASLFIVLSGCQSNLLVQQSADQSTDLNAQPKILAQNDQLNTATPQLTEAEQILDYLNSCLIETDATDKDAYLDVWNRVHSQLTFQIPDNRRVRAQKSWYSKHPEYMKRVTSRAAPYLHFIVEELEKQQLPIELALLPIVESAFDPFAYSHGRASGMWQFIPGTGKNYGLKQNWWYDGRRDIYLSTQAAIKYLTYLHKRFDGNWLHALAAYNSGEGNVSRAIRRNKKRGKPTDFWSLNLPRETKAYVPKLLALSDMLANKHDNPEFWTPISNLPYFARVTTDSQIDLSLAASLAEISMNDFYQLNPAYNQWATAPQGPHHILLPIDKIEVFQNNLAKIPVDHRISYKRYTIKPGDSLISIAKKFSTSVALLKENNNIHNNMIRAGKSLLIPVASAKRDEYHKSTEQRLIAKQNTRHKGHKTIYQVKSGDSMWEISRKYKVNMRKLAKWNNMAPTDPLKVGQQLVIWNQYTPKLASLSQANKKTKKIHYKVRQGDSLARIANKFNVSLGNIKRWNKSTGTKKYLQPGDLVTLYVDITQQY
ncbi:LysM peptidoglycan-binding domain-containing protein [Aliikangiella maris]|uniref:LysM peptidoglycan-binding domain-containing protein n=2 Tax=Aliikangiella maris TaxID=3162458 RepID=A0ABV3MML2_9GAMM